MKHISYILIFIFITVCFLDPGNKYLGLKLPLFFLMFLALAIQFLLLKFKLINYKSVMVPICFLVISLGSSFLAMGSQGNFSLGTMLYFLQTALLLFMLPVIVSNKINYEKIFTSSILLSTTIALLLAINFYFNFFPSIAESNYFNKDTDAVMFGLRTYGNLTFPMLFFKASPLAILAYASIMPLNGKWIFFKAICITLLLLSGTRANIFAALFLVIIDLFLALKRNTDIKNFIIISIISGFALALSVPILFYEELKGFISLAEPSNLVKFGHLLSYIQHFNDNVFEFLFGNGYGSSFFSQGRNEMVFITELTYLEAIRFFGLLGSMIFFAILLLPLKNLFKSRTNIAFGWIVYLFVAATNPFIFSTSGILALTFVYSIALNKKGSNYQ